MEILLVKSSKIFKYAFPAALTETFWIKDTDNDDNDRNLVSIFKDGTSWKICNSDLIEVLGTDEKNSSLLLVSNKVYTLRLKKNNVRFYLIVVEYNDNKYKSFQLTNISEITIGSSPENSIIINSEFVKVNHAIINKIDSGALSITSIDNQYGIYVNGVKTLKSSLSNGDVVFIMGYRLILLNDYLLINDYDDSISINNSLITPSELPVYSDVSLPTIEDDNAVIYGENDYYSRSPRFVTSIIPEDMKIDSPPGKEQDQEVPVMYTIGPMITMAMSSAVSGATAIFNVTNNNLPITKALPTLLVSFCMLASTLLWPNMMKKFNKKMKKKREEERQKKYVEYLVEKRKKIENIKVSQHQILTSTYLGPGDCQSIVLNKKRNLWERIRENEDYLNVRLGTGVIPLKINLSYADTGFTMVEDNLRSELNKLAESAKDLKNAPVTISLTERNKLVIIGETQYKEAILKSIILQLVTYHSYADLKLVFMINDDSDMWDTFKILPHVWSNSRDLRFFATNYDDMSKLSFYLEQVFTARKYEDAGGNKKESGIDFHNVNPYYLFVVNNIKKIKNIEIVNKIITEKRNIGFGIIVLNDGISNLPNECTNFLMADGEKSAVITNDLNKNNQTGFVMDKVENIDFAHIYEMLSNIPVKFPVALDEAKSALGFLELYKVGRVEQLDVAGRWINNNPVNSLSAPIGIHSDREIFNLDLHEKFHGPHGLVAGMTGSGKSEFIITFILSMCVNYDPREVSFVLIDYKGGGLTGAFENKLTGVRLPHLAGTITNLDTAEMKRSLASIQSELRRRQGLFNDAKIKLNESTLDIYKYQKFFRDGKLEQPVSHLFIISDEFAELKTQQPDFMQQLISTARIGRSLGVHLILATQKPSGIVDDQIWSNSRFRVCLKVQDVSDSNDVIKKPDAASLKNPGRFYLQVGYDEYFSMGQAAWAGTQYYPRDVVVKTVDRSLSIVNNIGDIVKSVEQEKQIVQAVSLGEELPNVLKEIIRVASAKKIEISRLWLDKIPAEIFVGDLIKKYNYKIEKNKIYPIIGEYDDPSNQRQGLLSLDFYSQGNTLVYGAAGSGKEILLTTLIYSMIIAHSAEEVNIYIIDFGSETFGIFKSAPQVGDVVFISDTEKINNLFKTLNSIIEKRKKEFVEFNGDINTYNKLSGKTSNRIVVILNNYEVFYDTYEDLVDPLASLSREGERYGIILVITATGVNAVRGKTAQNFSQTLCLQLNDSGDYSSVLGSVRGMIPSEIKGRGLVRLGEGLYEFQTAYPYTWSNITEYIRGLCKTLSSSMKKNANQIAILPEIVRLADVQTSITSLSSVPIGIYKEELRPALFDFNKYPITLCGSQDSSSFDLFIPSLCQVLLNINNNKVIVIDPDENVSKKDTNKEYKYYTTNVEDAITELKSVYNNAQQGTITVILFGIARLRELLSKDSKIALDKFLMGLKIKKYIKVIIVDAITRIKSIEYEPFYSSNVNASNAIWLGSGISDQFTIKTSTYNKETRGFIENNYGYTVIKGVARLVKLIDVLSDDE